jgi:hypothetical protein
MSNTPGYTTPDGIEAHVEDFDPRTGVGIDKESKQGCYVLRRGISPRHKILAGLKALGMKGTQVDRALDVNRENKTHTGVHTNRLSRDPRMKEEIERQRDRILGNARETLVEAVEKAASNFKDKVFEGDMKASEKVLEFAEIFKPKGSAVNANINMDFGSWLGQAQQGSPLLVGDSSTEQGRISAPRVIHDVSEIPDEDLDLQGERLTFNPDECQLRSSFAHPDIPSNDGISTKVDKKSFVEEVFGGGVKGTLSE